MIEIIIGIYLIWDDHPVIGVLAILDGCMR